MKYKKYMIISLGFALLINSMSCKKNWLDEKADKRQAVPTRLQDFQALMDNVNSSLNNNLIAFGEVAADGHYVQEAIWPRASDVAKNVYTWSHTRPYTNVNSWILIYKRIFTTNTVLDGLSKLEPATSQERRELDDLKGQALFNRACCFFNLAQVFSLPYNANTAGTDMGIPMRFDVDIAASSIRYTVKETYDRIITDIKAAAELLPVTPIAKTRGGKPAAYALLARTYLVMGDYENALLYAEKCLQLTNSLLNYSTISSGLSTIGQMFSNPLQNPEILFFDRISNLDTYLFETYYCLVDPSLYNLYSVNDLRRTKFFKVNSSTGNITFIGNYHNYLYQLYAGITTDEVYLVKAECQARGGNGIEAINTLNVLLATRFDNSFVPYTAANPEQALVIILEERKKELLFRNLRWSDLRRLNMDDRFKVTINRQVGGQTFQLLPNSYQYTFPLPDDIIAISGMPQTPGW